MSEAEAGWDEDEQQWRWVSWSQRLCGVPRESPEGHLPQPGMEVAGYRLERRLGTGGQGSVFRARREGRLYAVKFIFLPSAAHWAWRELDVRVKLWRTGGLPLEGHGLWPARQPLFLFLVMPLVRGLPLDTWARLHNPNALEVVERMRWAARQLAVVHEAGVVHRDVLRIMPPIVQVGFRIRGASWPKATRLRGVQTPDGCAVQLEPPGVPTPAALDTFEPASFQPVVHDSFCDVKALGHAVHGVESIRAARRLSS